MRNIRAFLFLGIWVAILPYLGFPHSWKNVLFSLSGLLLVYLTYMKYREMKKNGQKENFDNFLENKEFFEQTSTETGSNELN